MQRTIVIWSGTIGAVAAFSCSSSDDGSLAGNPSDGGLWGGGGQAAAAGEAGGAGAAGAAEQFVVPRLAECFATCAADYPDGRASLGSFANKCACDECATVCAGLCAGGALDDGCAHGCLIAMLDMRACDNERYDCNHDVVCQKYFECTSRCITPPEVTGVTFDQMRQACVDRINDYRAIEGVAALTRNEASEKCTDSSATKDEQLNQPHASFGACDEDGQNECFTLTVGYGSASLLRCLEEMFMEKFTGVEGGGHYQNMVRTSFTSVACGFDVVVGTQNFY